MVTMPSKAIFLKADLVKEGDTVYVDSCSVPFVLGDALDEDQIPVRVDWVERVNDAIVGSAVDVTIQIGGNEKVLVIPVNAMVLIKS